MFEIKIFANPTGYAELRLSNPNPIFSQEIVDRINFDSGDAATFNSGAYSIFYAHDVYVLTHHFDVSSEANFREKRVHIAVALKRGIILNNVCGVFESLKTHFQNLAKTYKDTIQNAVYNDSHSFRSIVQNAIIFDDYQPRINLSEYRKAIVAYETQEQLNNLLAAPNRKDFSGYNQIYVIPRAEAELRWPLIKQSYSHLPISNYAYTPMYELKFPDGHIMTIVNLSEGIRYECSVRYYKTKVYEGSVKEHFADWSIERSADGCVFEIPLTTLEPDVREYNIQFVDKDGKSILPNPNHGDVVFDGIGEYNKSTNVLRLSGKSLDWEEKRSPIPGWSTGDYSVFRVEPYGNPITGFKVVLQRYYDYSAVLAQHYRHFKSKVGDSAYLYFCHNGSQDKVDEETLQMSWRKPYLPSNVEIVYPATPQFNTVTVKYDGVKGFPLPQLEAKPSKKVSIYITNPNLKLKDVRYSYSFGEAYPELDRVSTLPIEVDWKAGRSLKLRIETPGYKVFSKTFESVPLDKKIEVTLKKTLISKILLPLVYIICAFIVFCAGAYCGVELQKRLSLPSEKEYKFELAAKDDQIDSLNSVISSYEKQINELQAGIEAKKTASDNQNKAQKEKIQKLKEKFLKPYYTNKDIDDYVKLLGHEDNYSKAAQYCLEIINITSASERATIIIDGSELNDKIKHINKYTLTGFYDRIMTAGAYAEDSAWQTAFMTTKPPKGGFSTVWSAYEAYDKKIKNQ